MEKDGRGKKEKAVETGVVKGKTSLKKVWARDQRKQIFSTIFKDEVTKRTTNRRMEKNLPSFFFF